MAETIASDPVPQTLQFDTHAHIFDRVGPFVSERRYTPAYDATLEQFVTHLDSQGLSGGVLVQPSFFGTDNSQIAAALKRIPNRLRGVATLSDDISVDDLQAMDQIGFCGHRFNLVGRDASAPFDAVWDRFYERLNSFGWHVEVYAHAADIVPLLAHWHDRDVTVVIDHLGLPDPALGETDPAFRTALERAAAKPAQTYFKISGPYRQRGGPAHQYAKAILNAVGPNHCLWGSDWPWTQFEDQHTYAQTTAWLYEWVTGRADAIAGINEASRRVFRF